MGNTGIKKLTKPDVWLLSGLLLLNSALLAIRPEVFIICLWTGVAIGLMLFFPAQGKAAPVYVIQVGEYEYTIPQSKPEVDLKTFVAFAEYENDLKLIADLTGAPMELCEMISDYSPIIESLQQVAGWCGEISSAKPVFSITYHGKAYQLPPDIHKESFEKQVLLQNILKEEGNTIDKAQTSVAIYLCDRVTGRRVSAEDVNSLNLSAFPAEAIYPIANAYAQQMEEMASQRAKQLQGGLSAEEKRAGFDKLDVFGDWGVAYSLAEHDPIRTQQILQMPYEDVFTSMLYNHRYGKAQKKYFDIKTRER